MTITLRSVKGSALTHNEVDANFSTLVSADAAEAASRIAGDLPHGSDKQVPFNDGAAWGADAGFTYDKTAKRLSVGATGGTDFAGIRINDGAGSYFDIAQHDTSDGFTSLGFTYDNAIAWAPFFCDAGRTADALTWIASGAAGGVLNLYATSGLMVTSSGGPRTTIQFFVGDGLGLIGTTTNHPLGIFTNNSSGDYLFHPDLSLTRSDSLFGVSAAGAVQAVGANLSGLTASQVVLTDGSKNLVSGGALGSAAFVAASAFEAAGAIATHAAVRTGVHGISITAGKTLSASNTLTLAGTDGSTLNVGTGGTLGTAAYTASGAYDASGLAAAALASALAADYVSPLTTKGDLLGFSTALGRLGVGTDTHVLTADSTATFGFKWSAVGVSAPLTLTPAVNAKGLIGGSVIHTASAPFLDVAQTWNNGAVTFTAIKSNVTRTAAVAGSLLLDLQIGGTTAFNVADDGSVNARHATAPGFDLFVGGTLTALFFATSASVVLRSQTGIPLNFGYGAAQQWEVFAQGSYYTLQARNDGAFSWSSSAAPGGTVDLAIARNAAGIAEINSGTAAAYRDLRLRSPIMTGSSASAVSAGEIAMSGGSQSTVGSAGAASALPATPSGFMKINVAGTAMVVPYYAAS